MGKGEEDVKRRRDKVTSPYFPIADPLRVACWHTLSGRAWESPSAVTTARPRGLLMGCGAALNRWRQMREFPNSNLQEDQR